ncbi:MAG: DNA-directed RNA polymerase subunit N [Candidatus Caldarchaeales archaeon]
MMFPIRCFSCGKPLAHLWERYRSEVESGRHPGQVLDDLGIKRYCCRRMFLSHVEYIDELIAFEVHSRQRPIRR